MHWLVLKPKLGKSDTKEKTVTQIMAKKDTGQKTSGRRKKMQKEGHKNG